MKTFRVIKNRRTKNRRTKNRRTKYRRTKYRRTKIKGGDNNEYYYSEDIPVKGTNPPRTYKKYTFKSPGIEKIKEILNDISTKSKRSKDDIASSEISEKFLNEIGEEINAYDLVGFNYNILQVLRSEI